MTKITIAVSLVLASLSTLVGCGGNSDTRSVTETTYVFQAPPSASAPATSPQPAPSNPPVSNDDAGAPTTPAADAGTDTSDAAPTTPAPDAGNDQSDAAPDAQPTPVCDSTIRADIWRDPTHTVHSGDTDQPLLHLRLTAPTCTSQWFNNIGFEMKADMYPETDPAPFCQAACLQEGDFTFQHFKLTDAYYHGVLSTGVLMSRTSNQQEPIEFHDRFWLQAGEVKELVVTADVFGAPYANGISFHVMIDYLGADSAISWNDYRDSTNTSDLVTVMSN